VKHISIAKSALFGAITFALAQPVLAVSDEEFNELKEQFNQLAEQVDENSQSSSSSTTVGGYGELHYNNLSNGAGTDKKVLDLHRFVIFVNHEFNDDIRFFSEFEIEHAFIKDNNDDSGNTSSGEVEVEQAFVQFDIADNSNIDAGVFLIPVGILNETHEPPTFYGVERNPVEKNIIPTTWWEGGAMFSSRFDSGFSYDAALTSGLDGGTSIRGGRQKTSNATANNLAATARAKYTGISGLTLSATAQYQDDMTQDTSDEIGSAIMAEAHARWNIADFTLTALYASWDIDVKDTASVDDKAKDNQNGGYLEASYKLNPAWGVFVRQNEWDNGGTGDTRKSQTDAGVNYWPHENVVIKADYQAQNDIAGNFDGFNLGVGYQF
jgi:hypothetical protein